VAPLTSQRATLGLSLVVAVIVIGGAWVISGHHYPSFGVANAESSDELLKAYAAKDTDGDGLPDWEEALYGTNPNDAHSVRPNLTDAEAVAQGLVTPHYADAVATTTTAESLAGEVPGDAAKPGSLTDQFAQQFFDNYVSTRGGSVPSADDMQSFVANAVTQLQAAQVRTDAFSAADMKVSGSGADALTEFAANADAAFAANTVQLPYDELTYFSDAVDKNDSTALANVKAIGAAYTGTAAALARASVPQELADSDLALVNAMARLGATITDLSTVNDDPIRAMLGLSNYPGDATALVQALAKAKAVYDQENVSIQSPASGWSFYHLLTVAASTASSTQL
jgi:hypothetical protein